jgi:hypothetical protein
MNAKLKSREILSAVQNQQAGKAFGHRFILKSFPSFKVSNSFAHIRVERMVGLKQIAGCKQRVPCVFHVILADSIWMP